MVQVIWLKLQEPWQSDKPKSIESKTLCQAIEANPVSSYWVWYLTVHDASSPLQPHQKPLKLPNCASGYQNIAKLLTHPSNLTIR